MTLPATIPSSTVRQRDSRRLTASSLIVTMAALVLVLLGLLAIFADVVAPYDPLKQNLIEALQWPSSRHWLGTDDLVATCFPG